MKNEEKAKLELERLNYLLGYWRYAEKVDLSIAGFLGGSFLLPAILNTTLSLKEWTTWVIIVLLSVLIYKFKKTQNYYNDKQRKIREKIENLIFN